MRDAGRPGRGVAFLRADAGNAQGFALGQHLRAVAGQAHRRAQRVGEALGPAFSPAPSSIASRNSAGSRPAACATSSIRLSTAQNVQPGATDRNCPDGVALCASSFRIVRTVWLGTV